MTIIRRSTRALPAWFMSVLLALPPACSAQVIVVNPLTASQQQTFFHLPEGGAAMPMAWYRGLEVIDSTTGQPTGQTFPQRMSAYGFLEDADADLPVGFGVVSLDFLGGLQGLSINCAACHVGEVHFQSGAQTVRLRILGGPNLADVRRFSQDTYQSILAAIGTPGRLLRFLVRSGRLQPESMNVLKTLPFAPMGEFDCVPAGPSAVEYTREVAALIRRSVSDPARPNLPDSTPWNASLLDIGRNLQLLIAEIKYFIAQGGFTLTTREGFGRLDAFATVRFLLFPEESTDFPFTAPVSVPHLWGTGQKKWLHWNNNTNSTLQRNVAQALGMGALQTPSGVNNVLFPNLDTLESLAQQISPPRWPSQVFGPLNVKQVDQGKALYQTRCANCHNAGIVDPATGLIEYRLFSLGDVETDPNDALNFHQAVDQTPFAEALSNRLTTIVNWSNQPHNPLLPVPQVIRIARTGRQDRMPAVWRDPLADGIDAPVYAALPLTGVWSTAPYLHNNSVPTLRDLLKPAAARPQIFMAGQRDFDPVNVGYAQPASVEDISPLYRFDTSEPGNSPAGHDGPAFGADGLTSTEVDALLEYLKSL